MILTSIAFQLVWNRHIIVRLKSTLQTLKKNITRMDIFENKVIKTGEKVLYFESPIKSESDKKEYRSIQLRNGLKALLISDTAAGDNKDNEESSAQQNIVSSDDDFESAEEDDEEEDSNEEDDRSESNCSCSSAKISKKKKFSKEEKMAACALCINVGSFSDPKEIQGLAHFLEHMVFMGSKKYPTENDFDNFLSQRGGSSNASTDCEHTTFYFEIQEKYLNPALDRFSQFFLDPIMSKDAISREREAVDSEFKLSLSSDTYRKEQLFGSFAEDGHPISKFSWGNLVTLKDGVKDEVLYSEVHKFKQRHYSANRMTLAIQARLPLDTLEEYVVACFSEVHNNSLAPDSFSNFKEPHCLITPKFNRIYKVKPVKDLCQLQLTWVLPCMHSLYKAKPIHYVSWLVGHEGKGSLISFLRKKMWCLDIYSGNSESGFEHSSLYALFGITFMLTEEGLNHVKEILEALFSYIHLLQIEGPQERIFNEIKQIEDINFKYSEEEEAIENVESISGNMHLYPSIDYLRGKDLYFEFDPDGITQCIEALSPDNVNILLVDRKFNEAELDSVEPWFQTKYTSNEIPQDWIIGWRKVKPYPEFHLPRPNEYLATDFSLITLPEVIPDYPTKIQQDKTAEVWYRPDPKFRLPECCIYFSLLNSTNFLSAENNAMVDLFMGILKQILKEELYDATIAELSFELHSKYTGIGIKVYGYNQKLSLLLKEIVRHIANSSELIKPDLFDVVKREVAKTYYNSFLRPSKLNKDVRMSILLQDYFSLTEKHSALINTSFEKFQTFLQKYIKQFYVQCLAQGNITEDEVLNTVKNCIEILACEPLPTDKHPLVKVKEIENGEKRCKVKNFNKKDVNSVITNYYQSGVLSIRTTVIIELLIMLMEEPLFNILRTQEQLGYELCCDLTNTFNILGFYVTVCSQASKFTAEHINERIEAFIKVILGDIEKMDEEQFKLIKTSLTKLKQHADLRVRDEFDRNWAEIDSKKYIFNRQELEIEAISGVAISDVLQWLKDNSINGKSFKKLSTQVVGCSDPEENVTEDKEKSSYSLEYLIEEPQDLYITDVKTYKAHLSPIIEDSK